MKSSKSLVVPDLTPEAMELARKTTHLAWFTHDTGSAKDQVLRALMASTLTVCGVWMKPEYVIEWLRDLATDLEDEMRAKTAPRKAALRKSLREDEQKSNH